MLNNKISKAVRLAIAFGAASTAAFTSNVFAAEEGAEAVERIEVTGSRIKRTDMESASPVTVITAEQNESSRYPRCWSILTKQRCNVWFTCNDHNK